VRLVATAILWERDPEQTERMLASCEAIGATDFVLAVDRKSPPDTVERLRKRLGKRGRVFPFTWRDDFSYARNLTLDRIPKRADWAFWLDWDDEIKQTGPLVAVDPQGRDMGHPPSPDVPAFLASLPDHVSMVTAHYDYGRDEHGNRTTEHDRIRFFRVGLPWRWRNACHEDIYMEPTQPWVKAAGVSWFHHTDGRGAAGAIERNLRILRKEIARDPKNVRTWYYLGNAYFSVKDYAEAAKCYEQYVTMSGWDDERWIALIYTAIAYREMNLMKSALNADLRAMELRPAYPDHYLGLAYTHASMGDWERARYWAEECIERIHKGTLPPSVLFVNMKVYRYDPYALLASVYFNLGDNAAALRAYDAAIAAVPDPKLQKEREHLAWGIRRLEAVERGLQLAAHMVGINEPMKAKAVLEALPAGAVEQFPEAAKAMAGLARRLPMSEEERRMARMGAPIEKPAAVTPETDPAGWWLGLHVRSRRVLMIGVSAQWAVHLAKQGVEVVGIDHDPSRVKAANLLGIKAKLVRTTVVDGVGRVPHFTPVSPFMFHWSPPDALGSVKLTDGSEHEIGALGPFDAVVVGALGSGDPEAILKAAEAMAQRVIVIVPQGDYEGPQQPDGATLRQWSQRELGVLLAQRLVSVALGGHLAGEMIDLHTLQRDDGSRGHIVAQYVAGPVPDMTSRPPAVIHCFDTGQRWSPDSLWRGGIGGSETAVIHMGRQLTRSGYRVTVYAEADGLWDGVLYRPTKQFRPFPMKLYVSWRALSMPQMAEFAEHRFLWMHDTDIGAVSSERLAGTTIIALSDWQMAHLREVYPGARIVKSGNGIVPSRFDQKVKREPYHLIWASSPDRGLEPILREWPKIRAEFPKATLSVFYGSDLARKVRPQAMERIDKLLQQPGIEVRGRVDQTTLAREYLRSDVLVYQSVLPEGSLFHETYCIMVVEAQAAGCVPITHSHGALSETNATGIQTDDVWAALRRFWKMPKAERERMRERGRVWAREQTWERIRDGWLQIIADEEAARRAPSTSPITTSPTRPAPAVETSEGVAEGAGDGDGGGRVVRPPKFARGSVPEA